MGCRSVGGLSEFWLQRCPDSHCGVGNWHDNIIFFFLCTTGVKALIPCDLEEKIREICLVIPKAIEV